MKVLIIAAHPDDMELGMGGTIATLTKFNIETYCYHTTTGVYSDIYGNQVRNLDEIYEATAKSLSMLNIPSDHILFDTNYDATALVVNRNSISEIQKLILKEDITDIYTHMKIDTYHQDHMASHLISMAAARRYVNNIYCFESIFNYADGLMLPNSYVDITEFMSSKCEALRLHKSEYDKFGGEKWIESVISLANYRGIQVGVRYAEAFTVIKQMKKLGDP